MAGDEPAPRANRPGGIRQDIWNVPNILTLGRMALIPVICWLLGSGSAIECVFAATLFSAAGFTDWLDGYIARKQQLVSMTGKFLDPLADKLLVMAVLVTLLAVDRIPAWFVIIVLAREMSVTGLRALAAGEGLIIAAGWGGKWKTAFQIVGLLCLLIHYEYVLYYGPFELVIRFNRVGFSLMLISLVFSLESGWGYFRGFLRAIESRALSPTQ